MAGYTECLSACLDDILFHAFQVVDLPAGQDHLGAVSGQRFCDGFADPPAGTGNQSDLMIQTE